MSQLDKPSVTLPLVPSYNERGIAGYTSTVTNSLDQRRVNCIYRIARNAMSGKGTVYLSRRPGVTIHASSFGTSGQAGYVVISTDQFVGTLPTSAPWVFSVSGSDVRVSDDAGTTVILSVANRIPVFADKTLISGVEQIVVQLRTSSSNAQRVFFAAVTDRTAWTEITDADFAALTVFGKMVHMDGFAFILTSDNYINNSNLNSLSAWAATSRIPKQIIQDSPSGLAKLGNQLIAFGRETMEVFYNAGNPSGSPLKAIPQMTQRYGVLMAGLSLDYDYAATVGSRLYFAGTNQGGATSPSRGVFAYDGSRVEKVSTQFIDSIITETPIRNVQNATFLGMPAAAFALTLPDATTQRWLMFFPEWNEWFEWNSTVFAPIVSSGYFLGVGSNQHRLYTPSTTDNWQDNGTNFTRTVQLKIPKDGNHRHFVRMLGVLGDTARSAQTLDVTLSRDDDQNFETARSIDMTSGKKAIYRCGSYLGDLTVRLSDSGNFEGRLEALVARIE